MAAGSRKSGLSGASHASPTKRNGTGIALLADETRRQIIGLLALGPRRPSRLAREIGLSRPAMTAQLHLLEDAGLIRASPSWIDGRGVNYSLNPSEVRRITAWLAGTGVGLEAALRTPVPPVPPTEDDKVQPD